jgi:hypothetical protein
VLSPGFRRGPEVRGDLAQARLVGFPVPLQQRRYQLPSLPGVIRLAQLPPGYAHTWAIDLVDIPAFNLPLDASEIGLNFREGDRIIITRVPDAGALLRTIIDSPQALSSSVIRPADGDDGASWRIYVTVETGPGDVRRAISLSRLLSLRELTGNEAAFLVGDGLRVDTSGPISAATYPDIRGDEHPIHAPWSGPNANTGERIYDVPSADKGWCLLAQNLSELAAGFLSLVYYNEAVSLLRLYLLNHSLTPDASGYQLELALEAGIDSREPVALTGAFFPMKVDPTGWSTLSVVIPRWAPETWTCVEVPFLYPMAANLPAQPADRCATDTADLTPVYGPVAGDERCNIGLSITITPYLKGRFEGSLDAHAVGQAVQRFGAARSDAFFELATGVFDAAKKGVPLAKSLKKDLASFRKDVIDRLADPKTGATRPWAYPVLGLATFAGPLAAVGAVVNALDGIFGSGPEPLQLALELEIKGVLTGTLFTPLQARRYWFYLPGRCHLDDALAGGMQASPAAAVDQRIPRYPYPLGLVGCRRALDCTALRVTHGYTSSQVFHWIPGADLDDSALAYWSELDQPGLATELGATRIDDVIALVRNPYVDFTIHPATSPGELRELLPVPNGLTRDQVDSDVELSAVGDEWDPDHGNHLQVRGPGSSYTIQVAFDDAVSIYPLHTSGGGGLAPAVPQQGYDDGVLFDMASLPEVTSASEPSAAEAIAARLRHATDECPFRAWIGSKVPGEANAHNPIENVFHHVGLMVTVPSTGSDRVFLRRIPIYGSASLFTTVLPYDAGTDAHLQRHRVLPSANLARNPGTRLWDVHTSTGSRSAIHVDGVGTGTPIYTDRDYTLGRIPECLSGTLHIATANEDKFSRGARFLSFRVNTPVEVLIGHDERFMQRAPFERFPGWLARDPGGDTQHLRQLMPWLDGESVPVMVDGREGYRLFLYRLRFPAGVVHLGGNHPDGAVANYSMYAVFVRFF